MLPRDNLVLKFWDRSKELNLKNKQYRNFALNFLSVLLRQDIGSGDITSNSLVKGNKYISAVITAKDDGIFAGLQEFKLLNKGLKIKSLRNDGDEVKKGDILLEISGSAGKILERERTYLNLLQRMSGIATLTNRLAKQLKNVRLAATRKTLWGSLDKRAVSLGNGLTHRINLSDGIIVKDNHLEVFNYDFEKIINFIKNKSKYIEIEVQDKKQATYAASAIKSILGNNNFLLAIMLDNIKPNGIKSVINKFKKQGLYNHVLFEASGNINPENFIEYDYSGVDVISMGYITNSAKVLNLSQEIVK